jgi:hypothetical protein
VFATTPPVGATLPASGVQEPGVIPGVTWALTTPAFAPMLLNDVHVDVIGYDVPTHPASECRTTLGVHWSPVGALQLHPFAGQARVSLPPSK